MVKYHSYTSAPNRSCFGLDPDTPDTDYEIHFVKATDPGNLPPDSEAWPLYYHAAIGTLRNFPEAYDAVCAAVTVLCEQLKGRRGLPPQPPQSPRFPNEPNPLTRLPDLGKRTYS